MPARVSACFGCHRRIITISLAEAESRYGLDGERMNGSAPLDGDVAPAPG